jgi:hypothetical protein
VLHSYRVLWHGRLSGPWRNRQVTSHDFRAMVPRFQGRNGRSLEVNLAVADTLAKRAFEGLVILSRRADSPERLGGVRVLPRMLADSVEQA